MPETGTYPGYAVALSEPNPRSSVKVPPLATMEVYLAAGIPGSLARGLVEFLAHASWLCILLT